MLTQELRTLDDWTLRYEYSGAFLDVAALVCSVGDKPMGLKVARELARAEQVHAELWMEMMRRGLPTIQD